VAATDTHHVIETVFRIEQARLIGGLTRMLRDVSVAEELAQDALIIALSEWPKVGVPVNPGAWLMAAAKRKAIDAFRRNKMLARKHAEIGRDLDDERDASVEDIEAVLDDDVGDEVLGLIFTACHPLLSPEARAALTLRLIGGLTTDEIARAFLSSEATIAQRIVRAKKTLGGAGLSYEVPHGAERDQRLASVLEVIYLIFNEGYAATAGEDLIRPALCAEAQRLGRILAGVMPDEPEVFGLLALMEIQASRLAARAAPDGSPILLTEQNRARWDQLLIRTVSPRWRAPRRSVASTVLMRCRPRSRPVMPGRARRRTRTGEKSRRCTIRCVTSCRRRWSISIAPLPTAWHLARNPAWR
jgi:RNA polymerase sigma factor (sigma-70 family)